MADLKASFEKLGLTGVKTILASGNVAFDSADKSVEVIQKQLEEQLEKDFGFAVKVIVRPQQKLAQMLESDPFKNIAATKNTRLYVLFLRQKFNGNISLPFQSPLKELHILKIEEKEVYCVVTLSQTAGTTEAMKVLTKEFGKETTLRNWNTLQKIAIC